MNAGDMVKNIAWLGHDAFRVTAAGKVIYIDPYELKGAVPADIILVTHDHYDHCVPEDVAKIVKGDTTIVTDAASAKKLKGSVKVVKPGDKVTVGGVAIEAVPAYNTNKKYHPKADGKLGFIFTVDGVRIYHAGDTDFIPEMKKMKADIALLPVSGTYVMTPPEAVEAALAIKPAIAIPMHYGAIVGSDADARAFKESLAGKIEVIILPKSN
ncbi:MAG: MBL fold metallo-hydrolase [Deltaproteobacteria bacterium]|nr:MBL fold metallo-hydrolase [Deltaproteobacteria bacterium]